jgi:hypothetical protein
MLKTPEHIRELEGLQRASLSPDKITRFLEVIRNDWGSTSIARCLIPR